MKTSLKASDNYSSIELNPETIEEVAFVLRMVKTIKKRNSYYERIVWIRRENNKLNKFQENKSRLAREFYFS